MIKRPHHNIESAWRLFEKVENELLMREWEISGVRVWKIIRIEVFNYFLGELGLGPKGLRPRSPKWRKLVFYSMNFLFANPFFLRKKTGFRVVIAHEREELVNGTLLDPITARAAESTSDSNTLTLFTSPGSFTHYRSGQKSNVVPTEIGNLYSVFTKVHWGSEDTNLISLLVEKLFSFDSTDASLRKHFLILRKLAVKRTKRFKGIRAVYRRLFSKLQTRYLYLSVGYAHEAVIDAAHSVGARSVEFQHGYAGIGHPGYDFGNWPKVPYFPDVWLGWGPAWTAGSDIARRTNLLFVGSPRITKLSEESRPIRRPPKTLLILSQGRNSRDLIQGAIVFAESKPDWEVSVKLHPSETENKLISSRLGRQAASAGVKICATELYSLFQRHEVVVGESSTALIEASASGCKIAIYTNLQHPFSQRLVEDGLGQSFRDFSELGKLVSKLEANEAARDFFTDPVTNIRELIEEPGLRKGMNLL